MRNCFVFFLLSALLLFGCVPPQGARLGDKHLAARDYIQAINSYTLALQKTQDRNIKKQIEAKLTKARKQLTVEYLLKAENAYTDKSNEPLKRLEGAMAILSQAIPYQGDQQRLSQRYNRYQQELSQLKAEIAQKRKKELAGKKVLEFEQKAKISISHYDFDGAAQFVKRGLAVDEKNRSLRNLDRQLGQLVKKFKEVNTLFVNGNSARAILALKQLESLSPVPFSPRHLPVTIKEGVAGYYYKQALKETKNNAPFKGFLLIEKAKKLDDVDSGIFRLHTNLTDHVDKAMVSNIAVGSFASPNHAPDAGKQFSDTLISHLYNVLPYGINILERENIDEVIQEVKTKDRKTADLLGLDLMVTGNVSLFKVEKNIDERQATAKVYMGGQSVPNPAYRQMEQLYGPNTSTWPAKPPRMISKGKPQFVKYRKGLARMTGFAKVSFRIFDIDKGAISYVKNLDATIENTSEFQDEVSEAGIKYKPLELPTEIEVQEAMRTQLVEKIGKIVASAFQNREARFLNLANFYLKRREPGAAFEPIAKGILYCKKERIETKNKVCVQLSQLAETILK